MFFKHEINPYPISDKIAFRNLDKTISLSVRSDAPSLVLGMKRVYERLTGLNDETEISEQIDVARFYARTLFGTDQGDALVRFYNEDALAIISACGMYFQKRLAKKITKAQKKK
jgi:hypothetical protein